MRMFDTRGGKSSIHAGPRRSLGDYCFWLAALIALPTSVLAPVMLASKPKGDGYLDVDKHVVQLKASTPSETRGEATFHLTNRGKLPVEITKIDVSCNCVRIQKGAITLIPPGEARVFKFLVNFPAAGTSAAEIQIFHKLSSEPINLRVDVTGAGEIPALRRISNGSPAFPALSSTSEDSSIVVETREGIGSAPWITGGDCDLSAVKIELISIEETGHGRNYVERKYRFRLAWRELPTTQTFGGTIWLTRSDEEASRFQIGRVTGSLGSERLISPTVLQIYPGSEVKEIVLFASNSGRWDFAPGTSLPPWLTAKWEVVDNETRLIISAKQQSEAADRKGMWTLSLISDSGKKASLKLIHGAPQ